MTKTKYLYNTNPSRWKNMLYPDALADRYECARKIKAKCTNQARKYINRPWIYRHVLKRYESAVDAMEFNAERIKELEV